MLASRSYVSLPSDHNRHADGFMCGTITRAALRALQFTLAVVIAALYGIDLARSTASGSRASASFIYAEVAAALSALTCTIQCFVAVNRVLWSFWEFVLCVLWAAQAGVFGSMYLGSGAAEPEDTELTASLGRMRAGVGLGFVCMVLWLLTFVQGVAFCCGARKMTRGTERLEREQETGVVEGSPRASGDANEMGLEKDMLHVGWEKSMKGQRTQFKN